MFIKPWAVFFITITLSCSFFFYLMFLIKPLVIFIFYENVVKRHKFQFANFLRFGVFNVIILIQIF